MGSERNSELWRTLGPAIGKAITKHARFRWEEDGTPAVSTTIDLGAITDAAVDALLARFYVSPRPDYSAMASSLQRMDDPYAPRGASGETDHPEGEA